MVCEYTYPMHRLLFNITRLPHWRKEAPYIDYRGGGGTRTGLPFLD